MIVIGYQGIGKSTLGGFQDCIDLESGNFWIEGKRDENWYKPYCNIALHLHRQGFTVFTSSHEVVRNYLKKIAATEDKKTIFVCYPDKELKEAWIHRLKERYEYSKLDKDFKAWKNAEDRFDANIDELRFCGFKSIHIETMQYDLYQEIRHAKETRCK